MDCQVSRRFEPGSAFVPVSRLRKTRMLVTVLMLSTSLYGAVFPQASALAQPATGERSYTIGAKPLSIALLEFSNASGIDIFFDQNVVGNRGTHGLDGKYSVEAGLAQLLSGSGLTYSFTGDGSVTIVNPAAAQVPVDANGSLLLDVIDVTAGQGNSVYTPYETAAPTSYVSAETIERYRGSNPADIFRGTPGVMSGDARNSGSAVDMNIRGMQGLGRVNVTIDGATNSTTVYQGYQGISNRTFVDPDFIGGVDITKGSDPASRGIAGTVAMRTLEARDIIEGGKRWGMRVKGEFGTNTSSPEAGTVAGYDFPSSSYFEYEPIPSPDGLDRPSFLEPTNGSGSIVAAYEDDRFEFIAGYAHRKRGNYHAGTNGPHAEVVDLGPREYCFSADPSTCQPIGTPGAWDNYYINGGIANFRREKKCSTRNSRHDPFWPRERSSSTMITRSSLATCGSIARRGIVSHLASLRICLRQSSKSRRSGRS